MEIKCSRIFLISDLHFGIRSNSIEWLTIQKDYYYNWLIPLLKEKYQPGDILFILGDIMDNRQMISVLVLNTVIDIFIEIAKILPIYIISGNHDQYLKTENSISSLKLLSYLNNIIIFQEPNVIKINNKTIFCMPWRANSEIEKETIQKDNSNYLFCHLDINSFQYNPHTIILDGNDINLFDKYDHVFDGHIHYRNTKKNITLIGCPYQLTRGDSGNYKGIYIFDPQKNTYQFIENKYSPKFIKIKLDNLLNKTFEEYQDLVTNNYVDIIANAKWTTDFPFNQLLECVNNYRKINIIIDNDISMINDLKINEESDLINFDIIKFADMYIDNTMYKDNLKKLLKQKIINLYNQVTKGEEGII